MHSSIALTPQFQIIRRQPFTSITGGIFSKAKSRDYPGFVMA